MRRCARADNRTDSARAVRSVPARRDKNRTLRRRGGVMCLAVGSPEKSPRLASSGVSAGMPLAARLRAMKVSEFFTATYFTAIFYACVRRGPRRGRKKTGPAGPVRMAPC